jgi:hypothetical protein
MIMEEFTGGMSVRARHTVHVAVLQILLWVVFGQSLSLLACGGFVGILLVVYFLGGATQLQNNMIVHLLYMSYTPIIIALEVKHGLFSKGIFG